MRKAEPLTAVKRELLDISMTLQVSEHETRKKLASIRYLRARRGIEMHNEIKRLQRDLAELGDEALQ